MRYRHAMFLIALCAVACSENTQSASDCEASFVPVCEGALVKRCGEEGAFVLEPCVVGCAHGACLPESLCDAGFVPVCENGAIKRCGEEGIFVLDPCPNGCADGACLPESLCEAGFVPVCENGAVKRCGEGGIFVFDPCPNGCVDGICLLESMCDENFIPVCEEGSLKYCGRGGEIVSEPCPLGCDFMGRGCAECLSTTQPSCRVEGGKPVSVSCGSDGRFLFQPCATSCRDGRCDETRLSLPCDENTFQDQCHLEIPVYCDADDGITTILSELGCNDGEGYICGISSRGYSECFVPCYEEGRVTTRCDATNYMGKYLTDTCMPIGYNRFGLDTKVTQCPGPCEGEVCADYSHIPDLLTPCQSSLYVANCQSNVALYCSSGRVSMYQDCNREDIYSRCGVTMMDGKPHAACHEPCPVLGASLKRCAAEGRILFEFTCQNIGYGALGYVVESFAICQCEDGACVD